MFYGLPIHIMRDLFMTARSFIKRLGALLRYRQALQDMNQYPDATQEDLAREDTCIICREEMRPWDPSSPGAVERSRPKKLPCEHILHFGCLKGWLERQQVCPTCRRPVVTDTPAPDAAAGGAGAGVGAGAAQGGNLGVQPPAPAPIVPGGGGDRGGPQPGQPRGNLRVYRFGPLQFGFAQGGDPNELVDRMRNQPIAHVALPTPAAAAPLAHPVESLGNIESMQAQLQDISNRIQQEMHALQTTQAELQTLYALTLELNRLRQIQLQVPSGVANQVVQGGLNTYHLAQHSPYLFPSVHAPQPAVTRHGGAQYTSAIPSGSPDLPEGITIPAGWSLLPLQRLHDPQSAPHGGAQSTSTSTPQGMQHQQHQINEAPARNNMAHNPTGAAGPPGLPPAMQASVRGGDIPSRASSRNPESSSSHIQREHSHVAAPTPVIPQRAGSSQLPFGYRDESSATSVAGNDNVRSEDKSESESHTTDSDSDSEKSDADTKRTKGKAKAVSFEEVEDDGSN